MHSVIRWTAVMAVVLSLGVLALSETGLAQSKNSETYRQLNLFGDVFERVRSQYVEEVSDEELIEAAINGMLTDLDPHSSYLNAKSFQDMRVQTKGEFGGLGIEVTMEQGYVKVVSPIDGTPAERAGVQPGDYITHLDGEQVRGLTLGEAVDRMRGKVGEPIEITIRRSDADPFDVTIVRDVITIRSVRSRVIDTVGYVRVTTFNEQTTTGVQDSVASIKDELGESLAGLVLDLRNNPGGLLDQAVSVSDQFLEQGEIVSTRGRQADDASRYNADSGDLVNGLPIVVLINGGSASASEIVAGALQDHRRAVVMGTKSFGKGSVQSIVPLQGHGAMRLTTARYFTPSGKSIQAQGIVPDIVVPQARLDLVENGGQRSEADLRGALANPDDASEDASGGQEQAQDEAPEAADNGETDDYQLARAIDILKGIALFGSGAVN